MFKYKLIIFCKDYLNLIGGLIIGLSIPVTQTERIKTHEIPGFLTMRLIFIGIGIICLVISYRCFNKYWKLKREQKWPLD